MATSATGGNSAEPAPAPDHGRLEFELRVTNSPRVLPTVKSFVQEILQNAALEAATIESLRKLIMIRVTNAIANAYPPGEAGTIALHASHDSAALVISIRDYGLPQDVQQLEAGLHAPGESPAKQVFGLDLIGAADELHWISYGPEGKALQITKWLHETDITACPEAGDLQPFHEKPPLAPEQEYEIRRMRPDEAVQVCQLIYKAYGPSYSNPDVYYPERVAALNAQGKNLSFVAAGADGKLVGHYALELNQPGPVAEGGQAVVDPAHRGRKLLDRLKGTAIEEARALELVGMYGDAVTVHTFSQKANVEHGAHLACVNLGMSPKNENFRGIAKEAQPQRITCVLYFLWLAAPTEQTVFVPAIHREAVAKLYANIGCPVVFGEAKVPEGHGELVIHLDAGSSLAFLRAERIGQDTTAAIRHATRELIEHSHVEVLYVELPLTQPGTPTTALALEKEGYSFIGIAPRFSPEGDLLRMVYLTEELESGPIKIEEEIGHWLVAYALADHVRVNAIQEQ